VVIPLCPPRVSYQALKDFFLLRDRRLRRQYSRTIEAHKTQLDHYDFSNSWAAGNLPLWIWLINRKIESKELKILEIGSYEGQSAIIFLNLAPDSQITCVDTWRGSDEHPEDMYSQVEARFDSNTSTYMSRITKIKQTSDSFFQQHSDEKFDLIYLDGSHRREDVLRDGLQAFDALKPGGFLIFDDFLWFFYPEARDNPVGGIAEFARLLRQRLSIVYVGYQIVLKKT
jgi:predicted O-methyltransferase YrrM